MKTLSFVLFLLVSVRLAIGADEIFVEGGTFIMGDGEGTGEKFEQPAHEVYVNSFYMASTELSVQNYLEFCKDTATPYPPSIDDNFPEGYPVFSVSWYEAIEYCNWLSKKNDLEPVYEIDGNVVYWHKKKNGYRLPTEAEWEYAARGGGKTMKTLYAGDNDPNEIGWFSGNSTLKIHKSGMKKPNELGLYDMSGNLMEWCWDWFAKNFYSNSPKKNPYGFRDDSVMVKNLKKVIRGGSYFTEKKYLTVFSRNAYYPGGNFGNIGFRVVRNAPRQ